MTWEIVLVFLIIAVTIVLFAFDIFPMDKIGFCLIGVMVLLGLVTPEEGISGFSNNATITILCLMIIAAALEQNGVISWMASGLKRFKGWPFFFVVPAFMLITGSISAFISSTAVVIVFIKIITELSDKYQLSKSKLLLPISYASILGGSCTLMGTSTNLIVNAIYVSRTEERLGFFEFSWMGVIFLLVSVVIMTLLTGLLPKEKGKNLKDQYDLGNYIMTLELTSKSNLIGKKITDTSFWKDKNISLLKFWRNGRARGLQGGNYILKEGDRLTVACDMDTIMGLKGNEEYIIPEDAASGFSDYEFRDAFLKENEETENESNNNILVELMMLPGARYLGKTMDQLRSSMRQIAIPIAIKKRKNLRFINERLFKYHFDPTRLKVGDRVLIEIEREKIRNFDEYDNVAILQEYEAPEISKSSKRTLTLLVLFGVIVLAATGVLKILASTLVGCGLLLLLNCISLETVYKKINWQILFLLAGMIPLGIAMHNTGADDWISAQLLALMDGQKPIFAIGLIFIFTMLLSSVVSNNATAIIMAPIAISIAVGMDLPAKPFILAVMFAANFSFFTPVGYQTNTLIYSMGIYTFKHFLILGGIISLILWILATFLLNTLI